MAKSSVLSHPTKDYFSRCFTWQVAMCEGNICAAHILNYMEYTSNAFLETIEKNGSANKRKENPLKHQSDKRPIELDNNGMPIIPLSVSELTKELIYQFGRNQIIDSLHYLISEGYLLPVNNAANSTDKVLYYSLSLEPIKHFIEFWEVLTPYRKSIMEALISLKNNKRKSDSTVYFQTVHSLILNDARFNIKLSKVYYQTMDGLILNDVYNVLRLIKTSFRLIESESKIEILPPAPPDEKKETQLETKQAEQVTQRAVAQRDPDTVTNDLPKMKNFLQSEDELVFFAIENITDEIKEGFKMRYLKFGYNEENLTDYFYKFASIVFRTSGGIQSFSKDMKAIAKRFNELAAGFIPEIEKNLAVAAKAQSITTGKPITKTFEPFTEGYLKNILSDFDKGCIENLKAANPKAFQDYLNRWKERTYDDTTVNGNFGDYARKQIKLASQPV